MLWLMIETQSILPNQIRWVVHLTGATILINEQEIDFRVWCVEKRLIITRGYQAVTKASVGQLQAGWAGDHTLNFYSKSSSVARLWSSFTVPSRNFISPHLYTS